MLSSSKELKNIPVSTSMLHDLEYNNLCLVFIKNQEGRRRAFSEKKADKEDITCKDKLTPKFERVRHESIRLKNK